MSINTNKFQIGSHRNVPGAVSTTPTPKVSQVDSETAVTESAPPPAPPLPQRKASGSSGLVLAQEHSEIENIVNQANPELVNQNFENVPSLVDLQTQLQAAKTNLKLGPRSLEGIDQDLANRPMDALRAESAALVENTHDDAQLVEQTELKRFSEDFKHMFSGVADKMDKSLDKQKYLKRAENEARQWVENMGADSEDNWALTVKSGHELRQEIAMGLVNMKPKYQEVYAAKLAQFEQRPHDREVLANLKGAIAQEQTEEGKAAATDAYRAAYLDFAKTYHPDRKITLKPDEIPRMPSAYAEPPSPESVLSETKIQLLNRIEKGVQSAQRPNHLTQAHIGESKGQMMGRMIDMQIVVPERMSFRGEEYTMVKKLGAGGDGVAYLMENDEGKKIVVKAAPFDQDDRNHIADNFKKFAQELQAHKHAMGPNNEGHDNLINLLGAVRHGDQLLTVTEFAQGGELKDVAESVQEAPISDKAKQLLNRHMLRDAMQGMDYVGRERNMGHYDIKPDNFFVRDDGTVTVADFGRAAMDHQDVRLQSTPAYISPELEAAGTGGNEKSDIWSLGVMLNEVVNGENPFMEISTATFFEGNEDRQLQNLSEEKRTFTAVDQLINSMTHKDPTQRPNISTVLNHSYFQDPELNQPEVKQLLQAIIAGDAEEVQRLSQVIG